MQGQISSKNYELLDVYVGIDVHKKNWKVCVLGPTYEFKTFSQDPNAEQLYEYLNRHFPKGNIKAVYEAGFCGFNLARELLSLGIDCVVVNPADVPTQHKERDQKSDKIDARKLATSLRGGLLQGINIPEEVQRADYSLVLQRKTLVRDITRWKNRVKSYLDFTGIPLGVTEMQSRHWSKNYIEWLKGLQVGEHHKRVLNNYVEIGVKLREHLKQVNKQIRELSRTTRYGKDVELLLSIPGIGPVSAMLILTKIGSIHRFKTSDQFRSFVGIAPSTRSSGEKEVTVGLTSRGTRELREVIIEASWTVVRTDPSMMLKFEGLVKRMNKNKAIIRIARSLLNRIRTVLKNQTPYTLGI